MQMSNHGRLQEKRISNHLLLINVIGIILSAYAYHVSISKNASPDYRALCDISESMSCSKVLTSSYSTGFGFVSSLFGESSFLNQRNSFLGMIFYLLLFLLSFSDNPIICKLHFAFSIIANISSIYLACVLIILRDLCFVCILTYVVNAINYLLICKKINYLKDITNEKIE
ncbi:hypothetical protein PGB90_000506 [Kerria lacca]